MKNILLFLAFTSLSIFSFAQNNFYWSGQSGGSDNIDQDANWFGNAHPASGDNLYFNNTAGSRHWPYSNYQSGSYFNYLITYNGAGGIRWRGDKHMLTNLRITAIRMHLKSKRLSPTAVAVISRLIPLAAAALSS